MVELVGVVPKNLTTNKVFLGSSTHVARKYIIQFFKKSNYILESIYEINVRNSVAILAANMLFPVPVWP